MSRFFSACGSFWSSWPASPALSGERGQLQDEEEPPPAAVAHHVLLVDKHAVLVKQVKKIFQAAAAKGAVDVSITSAASGEEALVHARKLAQGSSRVLVVMDTVLPKGSISALDCLTEIDGDAKLSAATQVVMCTGVNDHALSESCVDRGATEVIDKPVTLRKAEQLLVTFLGAGLWRQEKKHMRLARQLSAEAPIFSRESSQDFDKRNCRSTTIERRTITPQAPEEAIGRQQKKVLKVETCLGRWDSREQLTPKTPQAALFVPSPLLEKRRIIAAEQQCWDRDAVCSITGEGLLLKDYENKALVIALFDGGKEQRKTLLIALEAAQALEEAVVCIDSSSCSSSSLVVSDKSKEVTKIFIGSWVLNGIMLLHVGVDRLITVLGDATLTLDATDHLLALSAHGRLQDPKLASLCVLRYVMGRCSFKEQSGLAETLLTRFETRARAMIGVTDCEAATNSGVVLLLGEDERVVRQLLCLGHPVLLSSDLGDCVRLLAEFGDRIRLVLCLRKPEELRQRIIAHHTNLPLTPILTLLPRQDTASSEDERTTPISTSHLATLIRQRTTTPQ